MLTRPSRLAVLAIAVSITGCASARPFVGAGLAAEDLRLYEVKATGERTAVRKNPLGRAVVGVELEPAPRWRVTLSLEHKSSLHTHLDVGVNSANVTVLWFPFEN